MKEVIEESEARSFYRWYYVSIDEKEDLFTIDLSLYNRISTSDRQSIHIDWINGKSKTVKIFVCEAERLKLNYNSWISLENERFYYHSPLQTAVKQKGCLFNLIFEKQYTC